MELSLDVKLTQKLSPQMLQSVEILQMGLQELQEYVENALLENPTLDLERSEQPEERPELLRKLEWLSANDWQNRWYHQEDVQALIDLVADSNEETLYDHLRSQLNMKRLPTQLAVAVDYVLASLNPAGYLEESVAELADRCRQPIELIVRAKQLVQGLEPAGVAAQTLEECLSLQLDRRGEVGLALTIVQNHLEDMAYDHYNRIANETGATREEIQDACAQIRSLDPRPGSPFAPREAPGYIVPDLLVTEETGQLVVTIGDEFLPVLNVSPYYKKLMLDSNDSEVQHYLKDKIQQAGWMIKSIEQRKCTLLNCAQVIVTHQKDFFLRGRKYLQPMSLADVAKNIGIHESTVSRAIKDKYLQCKWGLFPLACFFSRSLPSSEGNGVSPEKVKSMIQTLIEEEDKRHPLSDQKLCDMLSQEEVLISRRTVAKYRGELGISSTARRKIFCEK